MEVRTGKKGQCFPCNFCCQWGFSGNIGFSSTTYNNPVFCTLVLVAELFLFFTDSISLIEAEFNVAFYSIDFLHQWWLSCQCGQPLYAAWKTQESGKKGWKVWKRREQRGPTWAVLLERIGQD